ncbi:MAG: MotA/TolQ/ExbB proton channel family protein [Planctomycetota bacterium]
MRLTFDAEPNQPRLHRSLGTGFVCLLLLVGTLLIANNQLSTLSQSARGNHSVANNASSMIGLSVSWLSPQGNDSNGTPPTSDGGKQGINFLSLLTQGGWFMLPLLILSVAVGTIAIERYLALRREKVFPAELINELSALSQSPAGLDPRRAYQACQQFPSSASYVLRSMLVKVGRPQAELETAASEACQREATRLAQPTSWLSLAAAVAPLIGLLGTVWGITEAFHDMTQLAEGLNRSVALANGIYVALVTTMVGLMIAIPSAVLSHYYENRIVSMLNEIEEMVCNLLPQFERYEGQVRFTAGIGEAEAPSTTNEAPVPEGAV